MTSSRQGSQEPSPDSTSLAPTTKGSSEQAPRRSSFNFLRRQKSGDPGSRAQQRSVSGGKMSKKQKALAQEELLRQQRQAAMLPQRPPVLPSHSPLPQINTFGGENARPDSVAIVSNRFGSFSTDPASAKMGPPAARNVPIPPIPASSAATRNGGGEYIDPYARTESMTHRGRYSYASSAVSTLNSPRRVRRRKDPTPFNILVIGARNSGKSSFIGFLKSALALPAKKKPHTPSPPQSALSPDSAFTSEYIETEMDNERIGVTLWDSQGLEKNIVDLQLREMASFLESKFEETFTEEQKVVRAPGVRDTHIHCVFFILDPSRLDANIATARNGVGLTNQVNKQQRLIGGLDDDFDLQVLRILQGKTTVIPVISKADSITTAHMAHLKKTVWDSLKQAKLDPLEALNLGDSDFEDENRLDERDEDEYESSDQGHEDDGEHEQSPGMLNKFVDRSSSEDARSTSSATSPSSPPRTSPETKRPGHIRKASAMSASINSPTHEELPYLPLSIISPDIYDPGVVGRRFPWGFADPYNVDHCDFVRLKESVFSEWRAELREASRELWYEGWRTSRLNRVRDAPRRVQTGDGTGKGFGSLSPPNGTTARAVSAGGPPAGNSPLYHPAHVDAY